MPGQDGLFAPDAVTRRVHSESVLLLGGGRALLMQLAHPAVAAGVSEHSRFREQRFGRLLRTLRLTLAIVYGTREQALAAARQVNAVHRSVVGAGYDATDPQLLLWVYATLLDTALVMHDRFVRPLRPVERETYYEEMGAFATALGAPTMMLPPDVSSFQRYVERTLTQLEVTPAAREIVDELFRPGLGLQLAMPVMRRITSALLPPRLREQYGLPSSRFDAAGLRFAATASRLVLPITPGLLRRTPWFLLPKHSA
jgi:uncharacterized protein (DUF2236 family)